MTQRQYFRTEREAEQWLEAHGYRPIVPTADHVDGPHCFNWECGLCQAEIRWNSVGFFIVERA